MPTAQKVAADHFNGASAVSTRFGFLVETECVPMILLSEREQFGHRTFGLA